MSVIERQNEVESKICFRCLKSGLHLPELPESGLPDYSLTSSSSCISNMNRSESISKSSGKKGLLNFQIKKEQCFFHTKLMQTKWFY